MADPIFVQAMAGAYPTAGILLVITASILAMLFMASRFIGSKKLESWIANEAFQCLATAAILFFAVGILSMGTSLMGIFLEKLAEENNAAELLSFLKSHQELQSGAVGVQALHSEPHMAFARSYLLVTLDKLNGAYDWLFYTYSTLSVAGNSGAFFPQVGKIGIGLGLSGKIAAMIYPMIEYIYYGFFFVYFQLGILELVSSYFFYAFPAGIVLRSFPFTRSLGSFLIASAVGLYFIYPFMLSLLLIANHGGDLDVEENDVIRLMKKEYPSQFMLYYVKNKAMGSEVDISNTISGIGTIGSFVQFIMFTMILFPLVALVATYTFIHQFAGLMEANISDLGRGLIRLI